MRSEVIAYPVAEHELYKSAAGFDCANQILQATSAIYVIVSASRSPQMIELCSAMARVHGLMCELHDVVDSSRPPFRADLQRATFSLDRAVNALQRLVDPSTTLDIADCARTVAECLESAASFLERTHDTWGGLRGFMSNCCATDIQRIAESRNE